MSGMTDAQALARETSVSPQACEAIAKILVLVRRFWVRLVFDGLAVVAPSNADHVLPLIAQPLKLGRLGVALVVVV